MLILQGGSMMIFKYSLFLSPLSFYFSTANLHLAFLVIQILPYDKKRVI